MPSYQASSLNFAPPFPEPGRGYAMDDISRDIAPHRPYRSTILYFKFLKVFSVSTVTLW